MGVTISKGIESKKMSTENKTEHPEEGCKIALSAICNNWKRDGIPDFWKDRTKMQSAYSIQAKGWKVKMKWGNSCIDGGGIAAFIDEDVKDGQVIRKTKHGENMIRLLDESWIPKNATWITRDYISNYCGQISDSFTVLFLPGNGFNHSNESNVVWQALDEKTVQIVATCNIEAGTELTQNYYTFGKPPEFLTEFAKVNDLGLVFEGYNSFLK